MKTACLRLAALPLFFGLATGCAAAPFADATDHCIDRTYYECWHEAAGGRLDEAGFQACIEPIRAFCEGMTWPPGCQPSQPAADACITLLTDPDRWPVPVDELLATDPACDLCP